MVDGVCGGIAEYFDLDPTLVRVVWVLITLLSLTGILLYVAAMIIVPANPSYSGVWPVKSSKNNHKFWGILLVVVGIAFLLDNLGVSLWHHWWGLWDVMLPIVLILAGVAFLFGGRNYVSSATPLDDTGGSSEASQPEVTSGPRRKLYRAVYERKLFGVCGGLGQYFNVDPTIVRVLFIVSALASFGLTVLLYAVMAIVLPKEPIALPA
jgi:phage shock protein C